MKKIARLIILLAAFLTSTALAHPFDAVNYECKQLDPGRDGIKCLVRYEGSVPVLYIRYLYTRASPKTIQERGTYLAGLVSKMDSPPDPCPVRPPGIPLPLKVLSQQALAGPAWSHTFNIHCSPSELP